MKDTTSRTKLAARAVTIELDAQAVAIAGKGLNAETYALVMKQRDRDTSPKLPGNLPGRSFR